MNLFALRPWNGIVVFQLLSCVQLFVTPWTETQQAGFPVLQHLPDLLKLMSIESVIPSSHLILCHPLPFLSLVFPYIRV